MTLQLHFHFIYVLVSLEMSGDVVNLDTGEVKLSSSDRLWEGNISSSTAAHCFGDGIEESDGNGTYYFMRCTAFVLTVLTILLHNHHRYMHCYLRIPTIW